MPALRLGARPVHLQPAALAAACLQRLPRGLHLLRLFGHAGAQPGRAVVQLAHLRPPRVELPHFLVDAGPGVRNGRLQRRAAVERLLPVGRARLRAAIELGRRGLAPPHGGVETGRPFRQLGVGDARSAGLHAQRLQRRARGGQALLRIRAALLGRLPLLPQAGDGLARLALPGRRRRPLFLRLALFVPDQIAAPGNTRVVVVAARHAVLRFEQLPLACALVLLQRLQRRLGGGGLGRGLRLLLRDPLHRVPGGRPAHPEVLQLAAYAQDAPLLRSSAAADDRGPAEHRAVGRHHRAGAGARRLRGGLEGRGQPVPRQQGTHGRGARAGYAHQVRERRQVGVGRRGGRRPGLQRLGNDERATAGAALREELHRVARVPLGPHHQGVEQVVQTRLDNQLVLPIDLQVVGDRAQVLLRGAGVRQQQPRGIAVSLPRGDQLLQRGHPRRNARQLLLAGARLCGERFAAGAGRREPRFPVPARGTGAVERGAQALDVRGILVTLGSQPGRLGVQVRGLGGEPGDVGVDALAGLGRALRHVLQHGRGVGGGERGAARLLHVALEAFDRRLRLPLLRLGGFQRGSRGLPLGVAAA